MKLKLLAFIKVGAIQSLCYALYLSANQHANQLWVVPKYFEGVAKEIDTLRIADSNLYFSLEFKEQFDIRNV